MIDTAEIRAALKVGIISLGSAKNLVDASMGLAQADALDCGSINLELPDEKREPLNLVIRKPVYIPDYDTPRFCAGPRFTTW